MDERWYVYQLVCSDGRYFTNATKDVTKTLARHYTGGVGSTRSRLPVRLLYLAHVDKRQVEALVKRLRGTPGSYSKVPAGAPVLELYSVELDAYTYADLTPSVATGA